MKSEQDHEEFNVLPTRMSGGPHGVGDPEDQTLRTVEKDILIPQIMKRLARREKCGELVKALADCSQEQGLLMPFKCRTQAKQLHTCLSTWYTDEDFVAFCTMKYLQERTEFRQTGIRKKDKKVEHTGAH